MVHVSQNLLYTLEHFIFFLKDGEKEKMKGIGMFIFRKEITKIRSS